MCAKVSGKRSRGWSSRFVEVCRSLLGRNVGEEVRIVWGEYILWCRSVFREFFLRLIISNDCVLCGGVSSSKWLIVSLVPKCG